MDTETITAREAQPGVRYTTRGQEVVTAGALITDGDTQYRRVTTALGVHSDLPLDYPLRVFAVAPQTSSTVEELIGMKEEALRPLMKHLTDADLAELAGEDGRAWVLEAVSRIGEQRAARRTRPLLSAPPAHVLALVDAPAEESEEDVQPTEDAETSRLDTLDEEARRLLNVWHPDVPLPEGYLVALEAEGDPECPWAPATLAAAYWRMGRIDAVAGRIVRAVVEEVGLEPSPTEEPEALAEVTELPEPTQASPLDSPWLQKALPPTPRPGVGACSQCGSTEKTKPQVGNESVLVMAAHGAPDGGYCMGSGKPPVQVGAAQKPGRDFSKISKCRKEHFYVRTGEMCPGCLAEIGDELEILGDSPEPWLATVTATEPRLLVEWRQGDAWGSYALGRHGDPDIAISQRFPKTAAPDAPAEELEDDTPAPTLDAPDEGRGGPWAGTKTALERLVIVKAASTVAELIKMRQAPADPALQVAVTREIDRQRKALNRVRDAIKAEDVGDQIAALRGLREQQRVKARPGVLAAVNRKLKELLPAVDLDAEAEAILDAAEAAGDARPAPYMAGARGQPSTWDEDTVEGRLWGFGRMAFNEMVDSGVVVEVAGDSAPEAQPDMLVVDDPRADEELPPAQAEEASEESPAAPEPDWSAGGCVTMLKAHRVYQAGQQLAVVKVTAKALELDDGGFMARATLTEWIQAGLAKWEAAPTPEVSMVSEQAEGDAKVYTSASLKTWSGPTKEDLASMDRAGASAYRTGTPRGVGEAMQAVPLREAWLSGWDYEEALEAAPRLAETPVERKVIPGLLVDWSDGSDQAVVQVWERVQMPDESVEHFPVDQVTLERRLRDAAKIDDFVLTLRPLLCLMLGTTDVEVYGDGSMYVEVRLNTASALKALQHMYSDVEEVMDPCIFCVDEWTWEGRPVSPVKGEPTADQAAEQRRATLIRRGQSDHARGVCGDQCPMKDPSEAAAWKEGWDKSQAAAQKRHEERMARHKEAQDRHRAARAAGATAYRRGVPLEESPQTGTLGGMLDEVAWKEGWKLEELTAHPGRHTPEQAARVDTYLRETDRRGLADMYQRRRAQQEDAAELKRLRSQSEDTAPRALSPMEERKAALADLSRWMSEWPTQALAAQAFGLTMRLSVDNEPPTDLS